MFAGELLLRLAEDGAIAEAIRVLVAGASGHGAAWAAGRGDVELFDKLHCRVVRDQRVHSKCKRCGGASIGRADRCAFAKPVAWQSGLTRDFCGSPSPLAMTCLVETKTR